MPTSAKVREEESGQDEPAGSDPGIAEPLRESLQDAKKFRWDALSSGMFTSIL